MLYHIDTEERSAGGVSGTVYQLSHAGSDSCIEVWPSHGFNCLRWKHHGEELLYAAPDWSSNPVPTRSGIPILYPFPNRIRDGQFTHEGKTFELIKNDSTKANAIHGFAPRNGWTVVGYGNDDKGAWLHGNFRIGVNAPASAERWPGDADFDVVYRFTGDTIRMTFKVTNKGKTSFPFGIGLHPYFQVPGASSIDDAQLHAPARSIWPLKDSLPSGPQEQVPDELNWNRPRRLAGTNLDTVYGHLGVITTKAEDLLLRAELKLPDADEQLEVWTTGNFRESVLFTPVHRKALCIEPYTCTTDAANLESQGQDAGWVTLAPGAEWNGIVEFVWKKI